jgi:chromosome segregation ATPase
VLANDLEAM